TKDLLSLLLAERTLCTEANLNNFLGVPLTLTKLDKNAHDRAVVEAGINEPGEMETLEGMIAPDLAIITGVGPAHLEKLGSLEGVSVEKAKLGRVAPEVFFPEDCLQYASFQAIGERMRVLVSPERAKDLPRERCIIGETSQARVGRCRLWLEPAAATALEVELPFCAPGMVRNAALAIAVALRCGISQEQVIARLEQWQPSAQRGEWRQYASQTVYLDSYNANPASMIEALAAFTLGAPEELPRLYVLGGMRELGVSSFGYHVEVAKSISLRPDDRTVLIGLEADGYEQGLLEAGARPEQVSIFEQTEAAQEAVGSFEGAVLLKGSRVYALEQLLPAANGKEVAPC
ncbi:MAG: Mur ligase family protein, partial [Verrucomicrobiota bacterium]